MSEFSTESYLEFLEAEFARGSGRDAAAAPRTPAPGTSTNVSLQDHRWARAAELVAPRSRIGFIFGVSSRDIKQAANLLSGTPSFQRPVRFVKRTVDIMLAVTLLVLIAPVMLVIAVVIRFDSPGGVFFSQVRVGRAGREFRMYKFRSMRSDAEQYLAVLADGRDADGILFKIKSDPRITRVGQFLRRYSLDEIPQLWNVLLGDMSLVGPRPPLPAEVERYDSYAGRRLLVSPGLTGLWQVSGRSNLSWEESLRLDLQYVEEWSLWSDLRILVRTIRAVVVGDGAY